MYMVVQIQRSLKLQGSGELFEKVAWICKESETENRNQWNMQMSCVEEFDKAQNEKKKK